MAKKKAAKKNGGRTNRWGPTQPALDRKLAREKREKKKAEEIAKVLGQPDPEEVLPPETVKESVPAKTTKKKKTKKKVNRGRKAASRKSKN